MTTNFDDLAAAIDKFRNLPGAPLKTRVDHLPSKTDLIVDFLDIQLTVDAFRGFPYPGAGPNKCS